MHALAPQCRTPTLQRKHAMCLRRCMHDTRSGVQRPDPSCSHPCAACFLLQRPLSGMLLGQVRRQPRPQPLQQHVRLRNAHRSRNGVAASMFTQLRLEAL